MAQMKNHEIAAGRINCRVSVGEKRIFFSSIFIVIRINGYLDEILLLVSSNNKNQHWEIIVD